jgi:CRP-like cAMP-binding protein
MQENHTLSLFKMLPAAAREEYLSKSKLLRFRRRDIIFKEGKPAREVWIITEGCVHLIKKTPNGEHATLFAMTPSEALCGLSAFKGATYSATGIAATTASLITITAGTFIDLLDQNPRFARQVLSMCCERMRQMGEAISYAQAPVEQRVAYMLLRLYKTFGPTIAVTHHELASMIGTRWETSVRAISLMKRQGWIQSARGSLTILDPERLQAVIAHDKGQNGHDHAHSIGRH